MKSQEVDWSEAFDILQDGIAIISTEHTIIRANKAFAKLVGISQKKLVGKKCYKILHGKDATLSSCSCPNAMKEKKTVSIECTEKHLGKGTFLFTTSPDLDDKGEVKFAVLTIKDITKRKKAEEPLRKSEEKYRGLFDESIVAVYMFDEKKNFLDSNQAGLDLLGYSREELLSMSIPDVDADPIVVLPAHKQLLSGDRIINYEHKLRRKDGKVITVLNNSRPLANDDGQVFGMQSTLIDITERKKAEEALNKVNRTLKTISECNEILVRSENELNLLQEICRIVIEIGGYRLAWVGFAEEDEEKTVKPAAQSGYEEGYLDTVDITWADTKRGRGPTGTAIRTGKPSICKNILTDPTFAPWRDEAAERGYASSIALPLITKGETFGALNIYAVEMEAFDAEEVKLLMGLAENLAYGIIALRTRAERKKAEEALRESEKRMKLALEGTDQGLWDWDIDSGEILFDDNWPKVLGYAPGERKFDFDWWEKSVHPDSFPIFEKALSAYRGGLEKYYELEYQSKNKSGKWLWIWARGIDIEYDKDGKPIRMIGTHRDITKRKKAEEELKSAYKNLKKLDILKDEFLQNVTHELRTPITAMLATIRLLKDSVKDDKMRQILEINERSTWRLNRLVGDLLDAGSIERGVKELKLEPVDINDLIGDALANVQSYVAERKLKIEFKREKGMPKVAVDKDSVYRVVENLLHNAIKFNKKGGLVEVKVSSKEGLVEVSVKDTGIGMEKKDLKKVFNRFFQVDGSTTRRYSGIGIGLALVKELVEIHGGRIWAESEPGKWTRFTFALPVGRGR